MKYRIDSTTLYFHPDRHVKTLEEYPFLTDFGYTVEEKEESTRTLIKDENGKRIYQLGTRTVYTPYIFLNSLDDLERLKKACEDELIYGGEPHSSEPYIEIYDGYRE